MVHKSKFTKMDKRKLLAGLDLLIEAEGDVIDYTALINKVKSE